jgi:hypothetical protein
VIGEAEFADLVAAGTEIADRLGGAA